MENNVIDIFIPKSYTGNTLVEPSVFYEYCAAVFGTMQSVISLTGDALRRANLESCTSDSQNVLPYTGATEGVSDMANKYRHRITIGYNDDGTAIIKQISAEGVDALNDRIVTEYIRCGRIWEFMDKADAPEQATTRAIPNVTTFKAYAEKWFETYKKPTLKPTTLKAYSVTLNAHLYPAFGEKSITEIATKDVQDFLNERHHLSAKSQREYLVLLRQIFASALEDGLITSDPASSKRIIIRSSKPTKQRDALTLEDVTDIIHSLKLLECEDRRLMALLLFTGLRRGEVLGLRWEDLDFAKELIHIRRNVTYTSNQPIIGTPKSKSGIRDIPLLTQMLDSVKPLEVTGYIVGGDSPITLMKYERSMERIKGIVDLHGATAHIFRHSFLTLLSNAGIEPKTIQAIGGHADIQTTMNRYVHSQQNQIRNAGKTMGKILPFV